MINVDNKVKNIYYMLCFTFYGDKLNEKDEASLGEEAFANIYDLFSLLLCLLLKRLLKKGLYKEYIDKTDELKTIRGKINLTQSIKSNSLAKKKVYCEYNEYEENCQFNQIIKTTLWYLLKSNKIGNKTKVEIKRILNYFGNIDLIDINAIKWDNIYFNRNNLSYKYIIGLCKLILNGLIVSDSAGKTHFKEFLDDTKVSSIYENFIRAYFRKYYPELKAASKKFYLSDRPIPYIPMIKTDITLEYEGRVLIIDAKFYSQILNKNKNYGSKVISNDHLNQIYVYVEKENIKKPGLVTGMLLYAETVDEEPIKMGFHMINHDIFIRTLDMNKPWQNIEATLNEIANEFKNNSLCVD